MILRTPAHKAHCLETIANLSPGKVWEVEVREYRKRRSPSANAFYWKCVVEPLAKYCGYTKNEMHDEILGGYFGWETKEFRGHKREVPRRRTTEPETLETMPFADLIAYGQQIAAEMGVRLPDMRDE